MAVTFKRRPASPSQAETIAQAPHPDSVTSLGTDSFFTGRRGREKRQKGFSMRLLACLLTLLGVISIVVDALLIDVRLGLMAGGFVALIAGVLVIDVGDTS